MERDIKKTTKSLGNKTEFIAIDVCRLIFAVGIVALHLGPMQDVSMGLNYFTGQVLTRLGVPFFFLVSGFFLQRKIYDFNKIRKYVVRLFQLYIIYTILYIPQIISIYIEAGGFSIHNLLGFVKNFFFVGTYGQLWYFVGLIVATVLLYLFKNTLKLRDRYLIVVVLILYVVGTIGNAYIQPLKDYINMPVGALAQLDKKYLLLWLYFQVFKTTRNGIFFGFPYMFFGYLIAKNKEKVYRKNYLPLAIVSILFR